MKLKLLVALVDEERTEAAIEAARARGATGSTVIAGVRGQGLKPVKTFLGLDLAVRRDVLFFIVAGSRAREILEAVGEAADMDTRPGAGIAVQIDIEDAVGMSTQLPTLLNEIEEEV